MGASFLHVFNYNLKILIIKNININYKISSQDMVSMVILMLCNFLKFMVIGSIHNNNSGYFYTVYLVLPGPESAIFYSMYIPNASYVPRDINMSKTEALISRSL